MNISRTIKTLLGQPAPPAPYFAEFPLRQGIVAIDPVPLERYEGLLFCHLIRPDGDALRLATVWATRDLFRRGGEFFRRSMDADPTVLEGYVEGFRSPSRSLWKRIPWYSALLGFVAFFGALEAIGHHYDWLFAAPDLLFEFKGRPQLIEGRDFQDSFEIVNRTTVAHRDVRLSSWLESKGVRVGEMRVAPVQIPRITEGSPEEVSVSGTAPTPGDYEMVSQVTAKAGLLRCAQPAPVRRNVTVWPKRPTGMLSVHGTRYGLVLLDGRLTIGPAANAGLDCELEISGIAGLQYSDPFDFPGQDGAAFWRTSEAPGAEFSSLRWQVLPVKEFQTVHFQLTLQGPPGTDWERVCHQARVRCTYRSEVNHAS